MEGVSSSRLQWAKRAVFSLVLIAGISLRLYNIGTKSLWLDELCSYWCVAEESVVSVWNRTILTQHISPLFHFLLYFSKSVMGKSELSLRLPSALFSIFSIPLIYHIAKKTLSQEAALVSMAFLAFSEPHIAQARNARPYSAAMFFFLLSLYFLIMWLSKGQKRHKVLFILSTTIMGMFHYLFLGSLFLVSVVVASLQLKRNRTVALGDLLPMIGIPIAFQGLFLPQLIRVFSLRKELDWAGNLSPLYHLRLRLVDDFVLIGLTLALLCVYAIAGVLYRKLPYDFDNKKLYLLFILGVFSLGSLLVHAAFSILLGVSSIMEHRYMLPYTLPLYLLASVLACAMRKKVTKVVFLAVFCGFLYSPLLTSLAVAKDVTLRHEEKWRTAVQFLNMNADIADTVLFHSGLTELNAMEDFREKEVVDYLKSPLEGFYLEKDLHVVLVGYPWEDGGDKYHADLVKDLIDSEDPVWIFNRLGRQQTTDQFTGWLKNEMKPASVVTRNSLATKHIEVHEVSLVRVAGNSR